jgi:hypothetical protein
LGHRLAVGGFEQGGSDWANFWSTYWEIVYMYTLAGFFENYRNIQKCLVTFFRRKVMYKLFLAKNKQVGLHYFGL